ncbi:DEAD/DEAH box helicase family protein [uncultured Sphingomonas sp.]|uniref:DEAD/DEAH box helicase family protein n=1 Tax=uncultured Sphingomonas sp. TaxID=158754 RepID=UPI0035CA1445
MPRNEADSRAALIDPALLGRGWTNDLVRREVTAAPIEFDTLTGKARRKGEGRADYLLRYQLHPRTQAVAMALIEAKAEDKSPGHGLEQAKGYRARHNVPFVFSSNGHRFVEFDATTGLTTAPRPMVDFPTPDALRARWEAAKGFALDTPEAAPLIEPYRGGEGQRRYYQDAAIRAVLEKLATGETRALLTLATGTGKTFIATKLLHKIANAGKLTRALFLCDRDELRTQGLTSLKADFGADAAIVERRGNRNVAANARVHVATYQTLGIATDDDTASFLREFYPPNYFSHIVIDECHRSAWGKWFEVLERNPDAVHIGLTATPRTLKIGERSDEADRDRALIADNLTYFGEPVYEYEIAQAIDDGYLAACEIVRREVFIADAEAIEEETGVTGGQVAEHKLSYKHDGSTASADDLKSHYGAGQFESAISIPERTRAMADDLFAQLLATGGPHQKCIVFCASDDHAGEVAVAIGNAYARWCADACEKPADRYAFRCTAKSGGAAMIPDLKGAARSHFVACTVDLLSTGVDVPALNNVVFFRYMRSPITFYQMIGRGTRIDEGSGKLMFRVYDYTDATRLLGEDFISRAPVVGAPTTGAPAGAGGSDDPLASDDAPSSSLIVVEGLTVRIEDGGRYVLTREDGRDTRLPVEEYRRRLGEALRGEAVDVGAFRRIWIEPPRRRALIDALLAHGFTPRVIAQVDGMAAYDEFDVLAKTAYRATPRTRDDRAGRFPLDNEAWLRPMPADGRAAVLALAAAFARGGTDELENSGVLQTPAVRRAGGLAAIARVGPPAQVLRDTRERLFAA